MVVAHAASSPPASLLVNRKAKQHKTQTGSTAKKMVRALLAHDRGDAAVLSRVRVPSVEQEDRKRLHRERQRLVKERTSLTNSIKGLLKLHGIFDLQPRSKDFEAKFADVKTACGEPLPPRARQEILRIAERLALVEEQIARVEAERDAFVLSGETISMVDAPEGSQARAAAKIAALTRLKAIGPNDATILTHEVFYRGFRNRRELASWVGVTPTPWASGDTQHDQGISRDGPAWIRAQLIQMAWRWLRYQPDSALSKWFNERTAGSRGRNPPGDDRGARPQVAHRALAVLRDRSRADWRHARLITRPRCSRPAGRGRGWAGWRVAEALTG